MKKNRKQQKQGVHDGEHKKQQQKQQRYEKQVDWNGLVMFREERLMH